MTIKHSKQLLDQIVPKIAQSLNNSATPAGPLNSETDELTEAQKSRLAEAINECFELLRINYQHLYFSAFPEVDAVNAAKRLWLESLSAFSPDVIRQATQELVQQSDFLPTISRVIRHCVKTTSACQLPDARSAYIEACNAASPKRNQRWSHPAVYYAGKLSHWFFLESSDEAIAFPVFKRHYEQLQQQLAQGHQLPPIEPLALPETTEKSLTKEENQQHMAKLRSQLDIL